MSNLWLMKFGSPDCLYCDGVWHCNWLCFFRGFFLFRNNEINSSSETTNSDPDEARANHRH